MNASYNEKVRGVSRMWRGDVWWCVGARIWPFCAGFCGGVGLCWLGGRGRVVANGARVPHKEMREHLESLRSGSFEPAGRCD